MKNKIFHTADENVVFIEKQRRMEDIMDKHITTPITEEVTKDLKSGDYVYITGTIYVARDAAHKRMIDALQRGEELPINIKDSTIYYMGPSPAREGRPIGSAGPTTATRMDWRASRNRRSKYQWPAFR